MALDSRHLPAKLILGLLLIGLALSIRAVDAQAAANPLSITAHVGYADVVKTQEWMPVSIAVTNNGPEVDGTLEVQSVFGGKAGVPWPVSYERPLLLAAGATKYFRTYLVDDAGLSVSVRVVKNGRVLAQQNAASTGSAATLIGVLSDDSTALDDFAVVHAGGVAATVVHLGLADVVDSAVALRAFDLLAVDDIATDGLTASQQTAIADFVKTGGSLLVGTGPSWRRTLAGLPSEILPIRVSGLTTLASSPALGGLTGVQVATGELAAGGSAWLTEGEVPLLADWTVGSGSVTMAAFDWKQDPISGWSGTRPLLRQVLVRTMFGGQSQQDLSGQFGGQGGAAYQRSGSLSPVLGNLPALDLPSLVLTGVLVLVYVLLVGPVNYFVLGALHRRSLAWVTLPLVAVLVAGAAYGGGIWSKGQSVQTNQVSILHVAPGSDVAYQETYTGVLTPTRGDYLVDVGRRTALVSPISSYNGFGGTGRADIRVNLDDGKVLLPGMTAFTLRGFATEGITAAPRLGGHLQVVNGRLTGSIENLSTTSFSDAVVIAGDGFQKLGPLAPGATVAVGFAPKVTTLNGPPGIFSIYPNYAMGPPPNQPGEVLRVGQARTQILSLLQSGAYGGIPSNAVVPQVVAWTSQSFQGVTVNGVHPHGHSETAVAMDLPVERVGAGPLPVGVVSGRIVDFEGDTQQVVPGALVVQNGTVTVQFTPRLTPGLHLAGASLSSSNPIFSKGPVAANGPAATLSASAWDWSRSAWVDISYQENGTTALPGEAINQATGEVRLRVTVSNGSFAATGIALVGNVQ